MTAAAQRDTTTITDRAVPTFAERASVETATGQIGHVACHAGELNGLTVAAARIRVQRVCGAVALALALGMIMQRSAVLWRSGAVRWLWQHGPGDPSVTVASGLTALLGLWMIVLAVTPGLRRPRTVRSPPRGSQQRSTARPPRPRSWPRRTALTPACASAP